MHCVFGNCQKPRQNTNSSIGFAWQGFGSRGAIGVDSVRNCQKLPRCLTDPVPAGSKVDPPLANAEPISDGGSTSMITDLRRGKIKTLQERSEMM